MTVQDILPITSITLMIVGVLIILGGIIWLAYTITSEETQSNIPSTEDIIGEMNQMFTYFTDQIRHKNKNIIKEEPVSQEMYILQSKYYSDVIKYKDGNSANYSLPNIEWASRSEAYRELYNSKNRYFRK